MNCLTEEFFAFMEENKELGFVKGVVDYDPPFQPIVGTSLNHQEKQAANCRLSNLYLAILGRTDSSIPTR